MLSQPQYWGEGGKSESLLQMPPKSTLGKPCLRSELNLIQSLCDIKCHEEEPGQREGQFCAVKSGEKQILHWNNICSWAREVLF